MSPLARRVSYTRLHPSPATTSNPASLPHTVSSSSCEQPPSEYSFITTMTTETPPSPPSTTGTLTPSSETSAKCTRTSSMPDEPRYTARLKKLGDRVPANRSAVVFTGADCSNMVRRIGRLAPPKRIPFALPKLSKSPGYYGSDARKHEKRTKRYLDGKHVAIKKGGPPVFSGSSETIYEARMLRLQERH